MDKTKQNLNYTRLSYGILLGVSLILIEIFNFRTWMKTTSIETYGVFIALLFLSVGIFVGFRLIKTPSKNQNNTKKRVQLSDREQEVFEAMAEGLSNKEIADKLFVSENTIKTHVSNILSKLGVKRRTQAILMAKESHTKE